MKQQHLPLTFVDHVSNPLITPPFPEFLIADPTFLPPDQSPDGKWHLFAHGIMLGIHHFRSDDGVAWRRVGRLFWASVSDWIGRKATYMVFFLLGIVLYCSMPTLGHMGAAGLFVIVVCLILTMYGGGFATVPAYLADIFGTQMVGAIHGRLLTAWSVAGIIGPVLIANIRDFQLKAGVPRNLVYDRTLYILAGLLVVGFICNLLIKPVAEKNYMTESELEAERALARSGRSTDASAQLAARGAFGIGGVLAWLAVGIPFLVGVWVAVSKAAALFT
jgi:hypothetical protein